MSDANVYLVWDNNSEWKCPDLIGVFASEELAMRWIDDHRTYEEWWSYIVSESKLKYVWVVYRSYSYRGRGGVVEKVFTSEASAKKYITMEIEDGFDFLYIGVEQLYD